MSINVIKFQNETSDLITFMTVNEWPFHVENVASEERLTKAVNDGWYTDGRETFWVMNEGKKCGLLIIHDIEDTIPLFDLRLSESSRGLGLGKEVLDWLKDYVFNRAEPKVRIEAYTRADNIAMRKTFIKSGFVKEGYLRDSWEGDQGEVYDALCYSAILSDWKTGTIRKIELDKEPY